MSRSHDRRLDRLEYEASDGQFVEGARLVIVMPDSWPTKTRDVFNLARRQGDDRTVARVIEAQTGKKPALGHPDFRLLTIGLRPDGPQ